MPLSLTFSPGQHPPPRLLRRHLPLWAFGLEGDWPARRQAAELARIATADPRLTGVEAALHGWNFERAPLDGALAAAALTAARRTGVTPRLRALLAAVARAARPVAHHAGWTALRDSPDAAAVAAFLRQAMADPANGLSWHARAFSQALRRGLPELARSVADALAAEPVFAPLRARLSAEIALAWDGPGAALTALDAVDPEIFPRFRALATAACLAATGRDDAARALLTALWRAENWHPGLTLRLHALLHPLRPAGPDVLPGRLFVFLYTYNRSGLLEKTLRSLAASQLGPAKVVVLDNGCTDDTATVCRQAAERFGPDRFSCHRLPVNVGAPAGRNWLAAASGIGPDDLAAYVDDDVSLPENWLPLLAAALDADPAADVAGARIVAAAPGAPALTQAADVRLLPPDRDHTVRPLVNYGPGPDLGLLDTVRPCPSVSGCCHLLRGRALATADGAPFDLRFSPSQFDDLARDLRAFQHGRRAIYAGVLAVSHHQHAGPGQARDRAALGQLAGARHKLDGLFAAPDMEVAARRDADTAWDELETKWKDVRQALGPKA